MEVAELKAEKRENSGKGSSKALRRQGMVPAIVYSDGKAQSIAVNAREFTAITNSGAGTNVIVKLKIAGARKHPNAIIKEVQKNPIKNEYFNIDFQSIAMDEKITTMVPVVAVGDAPGVKEGGILERHTMEVQLEGLPTDMPDHIEVDVSELGIGQNIHASDLSIPEGAEMLTNPEELILAISAPRQEIVETPAAAPLEEIAPEAVAGGAEEAAAAGEAAE